MMPGFRYALHSGKLACAKPKACDRDGAIFTVFRVLLKTPQTNLHFFEAEDFICFLPKSLAGSNSVLLQVTCGSRKFFGFSPPSIHSTNPLLKANKATHKILRFRLKKAGP